MDKEKVYNISRDLLQTISEDEKIQTIIFSESTLSENMEYLYTNPAIKAFLQTPMGSPEEVEIKKIVASSIILASENNYLPFELPSTDPIEISKMVDDGLTRIKVNYKVGVDELDTFQMLEVLVDKQASRVTALVDTAFKTGLVNKLLTAGTIAVMTYFKVPNATKYAPVISNFIKRVEEPLQKVINKGIQTVSKTCKSLIKSTVDYVKEKVKKILVVE